ncbi:MAG: metalloprotease TldD [Alphaproteobacteria bacterium]
MSLLQQTDSLFFDQTDLDQSRVSALVDTHLGGAEDGELYLETSRSEHLVFDDGRLKSAAMDSGTGFGLRAVAGDRVGYAHSSEMTEAALNRAGATVGAVLTGYDGTAAVDAPSGTNQSLYMAENPLDTMAFEDKVDLLARIDAYARAKDARVVQVSASLAGSWTAVQIMRAGGQRLADIRPLVRINVSVVVEKDGRRESGSFGGGGRELYGPYVTDEFWQGAVDDALRQALVNLEAVPAPAGEMTVVLGPGWPGVMLHEAVGHGLEGDFNRKKTSAFAGLVGEKVASDGVTVVDDGTIASRRGSLSIDDEGTPSAYNVLIEDGVLKGFMQDRMNARLMGVRPTGNGRRQSYAHAPMPRMTNTYMLGGKHDPGEVLASVKKGLFAVSFGGGQVDITSGKFVFSATEAYLVENGKIGAPVKGATLIGNGPDAMRQITMLGNDMKLDTGIGMCGKAGQGVPVGVGQPTVAMNGLTIGGTEA